MLTRRTDAWPLALPALTALSVSRPVSAQSATPPSVMLGGGVAAPYVVMRADLQGMPRTSATTISNNNMMTVNEGSLVCKVLKRAGVPLGSGMRGDALVGYLDLPRFRGRPTRPNIGAEVAHGIEQVGGQACSARVEC
ncbi:hypothetical protein [Gemmatimonas sp.]|uniref:hypothetical protein n=1 Tax=Gemmatimonas sp. TaxID=1962908 RepID=UPI00286AAB66|nr:hypothetical protein [Gemmatimonas sp.]